MEKDVCGSILLGSGVIASVISKVGSTEYYLSIVHEALIIGVIVLGIILLGSEMKEYYA